MIDQIRKNARHRFKEVSKLRGLCSSKKLRYRDRRMAVDALHNAQNIGSVALRITGYTSRNEVRIYACPECAGFHLTSSPSLANEKQAA